MDYYVIKPFDGHAKGDVLDLNEQEATALERKGRVRLSMPKPTPRRVFTSFRRPDPAPQRPAQIPVGPEIKVVPIALGWFGVTVNGELQQRPDGTVRKMRENAAMLYAAQLATDLE